MAVAGPFGTYTQFGFDARLAYWSGAVGLAFMAGLTSVSAIQLCCGARPGWQRHLLIITLFTLIYLPFQRSLEVIFHGELMALSQTVMVIAMLPVAVGLVRHFWLPPVDDLSVSDPEPVQPRLLDRLPPEMRGEILHLSVRDHYVEVLTDKGASSILMRFSDAMAETAGVVGLQVHRSHWVAEAAIAGGGRRAGKAYLTLAGGREVPVSRGFLAEVVARGYL